MRANSESQPQAGRRAYCVIMPFKATGVQDNEGCPADVESLETSFNKGDCLWAFTESQGFVRFTKGFFATFCVRSNTFFLCTEEWNSEC
jgi:hypothetical protein